MHFSIRSLKLGAVAILTTGVVLCGAHPAAALGLPLTNDVPVLAPVTTPVNNLVEKATAPLDPVLAPANQTLDTVAPHVVTPVLDSVGKTVTQVTNPQALALSVPPVPQLPQGSNGESSVSSQVSRVVQIIQPPSSQPSSAASVSNTVSASHQQSASGVNTLTAAPEQSVSVVEAGSAHKVANNGWMAGGIANFLRQEYDFPIAMIVSLLAFLMVQGRFDRNERKLRDAPWRRDRSRVTFS